MLAGKKTIYRTVDLHYVVFTATVAHTYVLNIQLQPEGTRKQAFIETTIYLAGTFKIHGSLLGRSSRSEWFSYL